MYELCRERDSKKKNRIVFINLELFQYYFFRQRIVTHNRESSLRTGIEHKLWEPLKVIFQIRLSIIDKGLLDVIFGDS